MTEPAGRVLVTGASRGIGAAVAEALAAAGWDLALWARSAGGLAAVAERAAASGGAVDTAVVDVSSREDVRRAAAALAGGGLAGVVLNAGTGAWSTLADVGADEWDRTVRTNLDGSFHVLQAVLPLLTGAGEGLVVGLLSDSAVHPLARRAAYTASKAGLRGLLEVTRREVREQGVRISLVLPSGVDTYFRGSYAEAAPGTRPAALAAEDVAGVIAGLFAQPPHVEVRELHLAAMTSTFGPFPERVAP